MGSILTNGVFLPAEGERNCYEGLAANWTALDRLIGGYNAHIGNATIHVTAEDKAAWNGKADASALTAHTGDTTIHVTAEDKNKWNGKADASALTAHTGDTTIHVTAEDKQAWNGKADASALTAHTGDTTIHVTAEDKQAWNGKADASALTAHTGDTTIHVTAEDKQAWDGHVADSVKHVTAEDKAKWDAVTSKADDSNVVHKGGNETIKGRKTFENNRIVVGSSTDIGSAVYLVNTDVVGDNANGSSSFEVYGSSISSDNKIGGLTIGEYSNNGGAYAYIECNRTVNGVKSTNTVRLLIRSDGKKEFTPVIDNDCRSGIPSFRWADVNTVLINGINPGALFLPRDRTARVDISAYFTNTADAATNRVTPPEDGYIFLGLTDVLIVHCFSQNASNLTHYGQTFARPSAGQLYCLFPVRKNDNVAVLWYTTATDVTVSNAYFIPCKGNI